MSKDMRPKVVTVRTRAPSPLTRKQQRKARRKATRARDVGNKQWRQMHRAFCPVRFCEDPGMTMGVRCRCVPPPRTIAEMLR